jgi:signal transduction histidine kinase
MARTTILTVDDEVFNLETLKRTFRRDYNILTATSGEEGLEILSREDVHIVITDQRMPVMTGTEFLKIVAEKYPYTIRIILTAYTDIYDLIEAINAGLVYKYVTKPWQPQDFRLTIQRAADHYWSEEEKRRLMHELREKNIRLVHQYKELKRLDEMKTKFMSVASHELRTPLAIISGSIELLSMMTGGMDEKQSNLIENAMEGVTRLNDIVTSVFDLMKIDARRFEVKFTSHNIKELLENVMEKYSRAAQERSISIEQAVPNFFLDIDPDSMKTVFDKLLSNAIKFTPDGGTVKIYLESGDAQETAHIVFKDNGIGIPRNELEQIFDKFYQLGDVSMHSSSKTKFKGGGTGLGLAICRGIISLHKGRIWAESSGENKGSEIHLEIPVHQKEGRFESFSLSSLETGGK